MSEDAVKVSIERGTERRRIILSKLINHRFSDIDPPQYNEAVIEDWEVEHFVRSLSDDEKKWTTRRFANTFARNVNAALARLHPPRPMQTTRIGSVGVLDDLQPHEITNGGSDIVGPTMTRKSQ